MDQAALQRLSAEISRLQQSLGPENPLGCSKVGVLASDLLALINAYDALHRLFWWRDEGQVLGSIRTPDEVDIYRLIKRAPSRKMEALAKYLARAIDAHTPSLREAFLAGWKASCEDKGTVPASADRSPQGGDGEAGSIEDESAVPKADAQ